jgi:histone H3/H4
MGYTLPGWVDEILDFIGINFPNVDEDDYREMADALREFAGDFEGKGGDAHAAITRVLSGSEGWAKDALEGHWSKVKASHLDEVPKIAKGFAEGLDLLAEIIFGMKRKAEIELGVMAASIGIAIGAAFLTGGLSALIGAAQTAAMRQLIKEIIDEAAERIVSEVVAKLSEPVTDKFNKIVEDAILDLADDALSLPPGAGSGVPALPSGSGGHGSGTGMQINSATGDGGMQLNSAGGGGGGGKMKIDPDEHDSGAAKLERVGIDMQTNATKALDRARTAHGRAKGKGEVLTQVVDEVAEGALGAAQKVVKRVGKHVAETAPRNLKLQAKRHRDNERGIVDDLTKIGDGKDGNRPSGDGGKPVDVRPASLKNSTSDADLTGRPTPTRPCANDPVDVASGELLHTETDLELPGVLPLAISRTHLSSYRYGQFFGVLGLDVGRAA